MGPISDVEFATDNHIIAEENGEGLIKIEGICKNEWGKRSHCFIMVNGEKLGNLVTERWRIVIVPVFEELGEENGLPLILAKELAGLVKHIDPDERFFV
jgi:hypothetical protein